MHLAAPSQWVVRWAHQFPKGGRVLDLACGQGRHMGFLSGLGLSVTGVDISAQAKASCQAFGGFVQADLEQGQWPFADGQMDGVIVTNYLWRPLFPFIERVLKPGGLLIYETFAIGNESFGRPSNPQFLLRPLELVNGFPGLRVIAYENGLLDNPKRLVQRLFAVKPNDALQDPLPIHL